MTHPYREPSPPRTPDCPRCRVSLAEERVEERALLRCDRCGGLWLPRDLFLDALIEPGLQAGLRAIDGPATIDADAPASLSCPVCRAAMKRGTYARTSGVTVDVCKPHGVWLDPSEITRILGFANANVPYQSAATPSAKKPVPIDAVELHRAIFPHHSTFWDRLGEALNFSGPWVLGTRSKR